MALIRKVKWKDAKKQIPTIIVSSVIAIGALYIYFENHYDDILLVETKKLELEFQKKLNLLDIEMSRIVIEIEEDRSIFDFNKLFIEGYNLSENYLKLENTPFAVPNFATSEGWKWEKTNAAEFYKSQNIPVSISLNKLLTKSKLTSFSKDEFYKIIIGEGEYLLKPSITFEYQTIETLKNLTRDMLRQKTGIITLTDDQLDSYFDENMNTFNIFFNGFTAQKDSRISDYLGDLYNPTYYFNDNVYLIKGYYDFEENAKNKLKRWYILRIGVMKEDKFFIINFNMPITEDYNELKLFNTLIHGVRIIK